MVSKLEVGDLFGLSPMIGSDRYTLEAQCIDDAEVLAVDAKGLRNLLETDCTAGVVIMSEVVQAYFDRYIELLKRLQNIVLQIPLIP